MPARQQKLSKAAASTAAPLTPPPRRPVSARAKSTPQSQSAKAAQAATMGIKGLMPLIQEFAPGAVRELQGPEAYTGRIVAIDASMSLYQFLIAIRGHGREGGPATVLTNSEGEQTSHIQGMFNRTIKLLESGVKPVYVFDGRPPEAKDGELAKRQAKRKEAEEKLKKAQQEGNTEDIEKYSGMLTKVSRKDCEDVKSLLRMMGVPVVEAPCEAEAQCGELVKGGKAHAVGTEDMDALTFGADSASLIMRRRRLHESSPSDEVVGGRLFDFEPFRTASRRAHRTQARRASCATSPSRRRARTPTRRSSRSRINACWRVWS